MENDKDVLVFTDENGEDFEMEVFDYFVYDGEEYALLIEAVDDESECHDCDCGCGEKELYIMKVVRDGEEEDFIEVDENIMNELIDYVEDMYFEDEDEE